ncbi:Chitinase 4 [Clarireedia jacksonii]
MVSDGGRKSQSHGDLRWPELTSAKAVPTPYQIFNQKKGSPYSKQRFYELVKLYHPDRYDHDSASAVLSYETKLSRYRLIIAANDILSDPIKRGAYDRYGAGWNGQPEILDPRDRTHSAAWGDQNSHGWRSPGGPSQNATWEDWERWYQRDAKGHQEPQFVSNTAFVLIIVIFAALGGIGQATRVENYSVTFLEQRDALHTKMSKELNQRRKESTTGFGSREERIHSFLRQRDPTGYGVTDPRDEAYRKLLPNPEICSSEDIKSRSLVLYQPKDNPKGYLTDGWADTDIHFEGDSWNDTGVNLYGCLKQLNILKSRNRSLKVLLSIGGWTYSSNFAAPASTASGREKFAQSSVQLIKDLGFDGIDIDWEYPKNADEAQHYVLLLQECRRAMDAYSATLPTPHHFELTVACPAGPQNYNKMDIAGMNRYLDFWNLMAYDFAGSWDSLAGHQANIFPSRSNPASTPYNAEDAVNHYMAQGVYRHNIVLGMPLYGRAFEGTDGLGRGYSGVGEGTWENGVHDFKKLPKDGAREICDEEALASYSYDASRKVLISYDTVEVARKKAHYIRQKGLGGAMWWESSADRPEPENSLIHNVVSVLGILDKSPNCITYPQSKYENLRKGF